MPVAGLVMVALMVALGFSSCGKRAEEETATKGKLTVCATESHLALVEKEASEFTSLYKEAQISVVGAETREAIVNLLNDSVRVIVADRSLNAEEQGVAKTQKVGIEEIAIAKDALAVVVSSLNGTSTFTMESLRDIFTRKVTDWSQVEESGLMGPIVTILTGPNSGAYDLLKDVFLKLGEDIPLSAVMGSQREVIDYVGSHPQAIGLVSVACYRDPALAAVVSDSTGRVKGLAFAGTDSTGQMAIHRLHQANIYLGRYPLTYNVYLYFRKSSYLAAGFSGFVAGPTGQKIILDWGLVPVTMPVRIVTLT